MTKLKLSEWASIAEIIGALAVVASLFYVGYQIKHNTDSPPDFHSRETGKANSISHFIIC